MITSCPIRGMYSGHVITNGSIRGQYTGHMNWPIWYTGHVITCWPIRLFWLLISNWPIRGQYSKHWSLTDWLQRGCPLYDTCSGGYTRTRDSLPGGAIFCRNLWGKICVFGRKCDIHGIWICRTSFYPLLMLFLLNWPIFNPHLHNSSAEYWAWVQGAAPGSTRAVTRTS